MTQSPQYTGQTWTTAELLGAVKDEAALPDSSRFTDADILRTADQCIASILTEPLIRSLPLGGRTLTWLDIPSSDGLVGGSEFFLPYRAASSDIAHVDYYHDGQRFSRLDQIEASEAVFFQPRGSTPTHYFFKAGRIVVVPPPSSVPASAKLRIWYPLKHPQLIESAGNTLFIGAMTSSVTTGGTCTLQFTADVSTATGFSSAYFDVYAAYSPHAPLMTGLRATGQPSAASIAFDGGPDNTADYVSLVADSAAKIANAGASDCVQLPDSFRKALTCLTASYILGQIGDTAEANRLTGVFSNELRVIEASIAPRTKGPAIIHTNRRSYSRARAWAWWW